MQGSLTKIRIVALLILVLGAAASFFAVAHLLPAERLGVVQSIIRPYSLGWDLRGGTELLYQADFTNFSGTSRSEAMAGLRDVVERRVNLFGVTEPRVQVETAGAEYRLSVALAGVKDIREAIRLIGETPFLEFKEVRAPEEAKAIQEVLAKGEELSTDPYFVSTGLTGRYLKRAELEFDPTTALPLIGVEFDTEGEALFAKITERNIAKPLGIYLDGFLISAPTVREKIAGGRAQITGQFTLPEARDLVRRLNSGALPVPIKLVSQLSEEASRGAASLRASLQAALVGFLAVAIFMVLWYRLPGLIALIALLIYTAVTLSLFKLIPVTLTAAGIAGFVLSLGMAVDANILIFERMKEELKSGKAIPQAIGEGFQRAWTSIRDSNVSSLITAVILYWFGTSIVKGFALTLGIGILISMFSALSVSRTFFLSVTTRRLEKHRALFLSGWARR